ncbi:RxLR-like protein [Plasmopara halstedii]|uniref:RxLR-like protein n=1 Tax=Plasmopara halstedii TaxID=4781 RepID=A0A0P1AWM8_PLAHL|nr:RxLR-like protein [Plasmopara halstedii]CEG46012.1 RxLR-like protein [Plasmopara halstedii]|eukprot:XP_024582381.1 RxLR-like protein [Plasmopara halstedii]
MRSQALRGLLLSLLALCQGVKLKWVTEPDRALQILKSTGNKGQLIEAKLSLPAWSPVISLESINEEQWRRMKMHLMKVIQVLQPISQLTTIFESYGQKALMSNAVIDAFKLNEVIVACFYNYVFEREFDPDKFAEVCHATWEWRKEIALKGVADTGVKQRTVEWCVEEIRKTPRLYDLFGEKWVESEYYSLILQPFVISPAINITDIAVIIKAWVKTTSVTEHITSASIRQCICSAHPFPVIERYFPFGDAAMRIAPNTHILIPLDEMADDAFAAGIDLTFGAGSRGCVGRHIAMKAMVGLFTDNLVRSDKFQPKLNHRYSGRHNDGKETMKEIWYQVQYVVRTLCAAAMNRV